LNRTSIAAQPLVSVVMTVLDPDPRYFPAAVASMLAQGYSNLELVIVEDPSPRSAGDLLKAFSDPRIVHHANPERTSHSRQRNQSLAIARGELVATLDADDVCEPARIGKQVQFLAEHPDVAVVGTQLAIIDAEGRSIGSRKYPASHDAIVAAMPHFNPIAQPSVMFRKKAVVEAGGYRYDRYPAVEDYELWSRLATQGVKFANLPEALLKYRLHPGGMKATRLRGILRGTLDVKNRYWRSQLGLSGHLRMALERLLLLVPPAITYQLFTWMVLRSRAPASSRANGG
jgi:glycosyltransferase involved in cell wall biosynthesis